MVPETIYSVHILFADGSNPYVRYHMNLEEFGDELKKWSRNHILEPMATSQVSCLGVFMHFRAKERQRKRQ